MSRAYLTAALSIMILSTAAMGEKLDLKQGMVSLAGTVGLFDLKWKDVTKISNVDPTFQTNFFADYFVIDYLAFGLGLSASTGLTGDKTVPILVGPRIGLQYFFEVDSIVYPYLGFETGADFEILAGTVAYEIPASLKAGIVVALHERVGMEIGVKPTFHIPLQTNPVYSMELFAGYLGIRGIF